MARSSIPTAAHRLTRARVILVAATAAAALDGGGATTRAAPRSREGARSVGLPAQHLGGPGDRGDLAVSFEWFEEDTGRSPTAHPVSVADQDRFRAVPGSGSLGFRATTVWLRFRVAYDGDAPATRVLQLDFMPGIANLYRQGTVGLSPVATSGIDLPFSERPIQDTRIALTIGLQPHEDSTFWLEVRSDEVMWARASLLSEGVYARRAALR